MKTARNKAVIGVNLSMAEFYDAGLASSKGHPTANPGSGDDDITDAGLVHLKGLTELQYLNLANSKVSDAGLVHLGLLSKLQSLDLTATPGQRRGIDLPHRVAQTPNVEPGGSDVTPEG